MASVLLFDRPQHLVAALLGWAVFAISCAYSLLALLWVVTGMAVLKILLRTTASEEGRYGFLVWLGFWSAWPYVIYAKTAWIEPISPSAS
nr:hypothetical protein [Pseudomonas aeruginosa]